MKHVQSFALFVTALGASFVTANNGNCRATGGYVQQPSGTASFTVYSGCESPACGITANGYTAAISQLTFGAGPNEGAGDACGRCFAITGNYDPYTPDWKGPFKTIVVKANNLCPAAPNEQWCGQTMANPVNQVNATVHFDLCQESGAASAFFTEGRGALRGIYKEVSCDQWSGSDGVGLWGGSCLAGETAALWPSKACGNVGQAP